MSMRGGLWRLLTWRNFLDAVLVLLGSGALAGLSFVYTVTQYFRSQTLGTGRVTTISDLPEEVVSAIGIVLLSLTLSFILVTMVYRGNFLRGFYASMSMSVFALVFLWLGYLYPEMAGMVTYTEYYVIWAMKEVFVAMLFIFPVGIVGSVVGMFFAERIES